MSFSLSLVLATCVYLVGMFIVGIATSRLAGQDYDSYTIGNKAFPGWVIALTLITSALGAGDMFGNADGGYTNGLSHLAWVLGENTGKVLFGLVAAGFLAKYAYRTIADFADDLIVRDKTTKAIIGGILCLPGIAWTGGQAMCVGMIYRIFTGNDPTWIILLSTFVFIAYTALGGIRAVVWTDVIQSGLIFICGIGYYVAVFGNVNYSLTTLAERAQTVSPTFWSFSAVTPSKLISLMLTSLLGVSVFQMYWQRVFSCRDPKEAKRAFTSMGLVSIVVTTATTLTGILARTMDPSIQGGSIAWLVRESLPEWMQISFVMAMIAATMSSADSLLNSAAVNIVNDVIRPYKPNISDKQLVNYTAIATVVIGLISLAGSLKFTFVLDLASIGYAGAGGTIAPFLLLGLFWKKDKSKGFSAENSRVTVPAGRAGLLAGVITAIIVQLSPKLSAVFGGGVIPAIVVTTVSIVAVSLLTTGKAQPIETAAD